MGVPYGTTKGQAVGLQPTSQKVKDTINNLNKADVIANQIEKAVDKLELGDNPASAAIRAAQLYIEARSKSNVNAVAYESLKEGLLAQLARATGEVGVLTDQDIQRARSLLPSFNDTKETAKAKISQLRSFFSDLKKSIGPTGSSNPEENQITQPDGTVWQQNEDGSYTRIK